MPCQLRIHSIDDVDKSIIHHSHMVLVMFTVNFNIHDALWLYVTAQTNGDLWYIIVYCNLIDLCLSWRLDGILLGHFL